MHSRPQACAIVARGQALAKAQEMVAKPAALRANPQIASPQGPNTQSDTNHCARSCDAAKADSKLAVNATET
jgi:hypothetical protein